MPATRQRTATKTKTYRCVKGFSYPADAGIRERIKGGERIPIEERGEWTRHVIGDKLKESDLPPEVFAGMIQRGAIAPTAKAEEAPDGPQE